MKKKVLVLHNIVAPYRLPLFEELAKKFNLLVLFLQENDNRRLWDTSLNDKKFKWENIASPYINIFSKRLTFPRVKQLNRLINKHEIIILTTDAPNILIMLYAYFISSIYGKKIIVWSSLRKGYFINSYNDLPSRIIKFVFGFIYKKASSFIAYGVDAKKYLISKGIDSKIIFIGTQCLLIDSSPTKNKSNLNPEKIKVITVGYLNKLKGIDILIKAFRLIENDNISLSIVGKGNMEEDLKKISKGDKRIKFIGYIDGNEKYEKYKNSDIFVMPSYMDAWGLVVNEAMYFSLPIIISSGVACSKELVRDNGYIFPSGNVEALKYYLNLLIENDKLRLSMGNNSAKIIPKYSIKYSAQAFHNAINQTAS